jgi:adenine-specific DNA-methyltransferase
MNQEQEPNHIALTSPDGREARLAELRRLFPDLFDGEGLLDEKALKQLISEEVGHVTERFRFEWAGKAQSKRFAFAPSKATLVYDAARSVNADGTPSKTGETLQENTSQNLIIEGDNLEALKLLFASYQESVKCIYIDPPYNKDADVIYPDDYSETREAYWEREGSRKEGVRLTALSESTGRKHSQWLNFMQARLLQARNLLKPDGVILMSIGSDEEHNLRKLADDVFGETNFVAKMIWAAGRKNDSKLVSVSHEYIIVYAKDKAYLDEKKVLWRERKKGIDDIYKKYGQLKKQHKDDIETIQNELKEWFSTLDDGVPAKRHKHYSAVDKKGVYFPADISWPGGGGPKYPVEHPNGKPVAIPARGWMFGDPEKMKLAIKEKRVHFGPDETYVPCIKLYLTESEYEVPYSVFYQDGRASTKRLRTLLGGDYFEHPKDELVLQELIEAMSYNAPEGIFMDFFAGSGTFAHSVLLQNAVDGGTRRFVLIQVPEKIEVRGDEKAQKRAKATLEAGYNRISDITIDRVTKAGRKVASGKVKGALDTGFRVLELAKSHFPKNTFIPDPEKSEADNLKALEDHLNAAAQLRLFGDDGFHSVITEIALKNGFGLFYTLVKQGDYTKNAVYRLSGNEKDALICLDAVLDGATIEALKAASDEQLIVLRAALDTTKKFELQTAFRDNLWVV